MLTIFVIAALAQVAAPASPEQPARTTRPVLAFPEAGLDDSAAYQGYRTRFYRDAADNTVQLYLDQREARVVHLWADAENESIGFTARDARGRPAPLRWQGEAARISRAGRSRALEYDLVTDAPAVHLGHFLLGSMRVERDFQAWKRHRAPFDAPAFVLPEYDRLLAALHRLDPAERRRHLQPLGAAGERALRARLQPTLTTRAEPGRWLARVVQPSIDGRDTIALELRADPRRVAADRAGGAVVLRSRDGGPVRFTVRVATTGTPLTPLTREEIFTPDFLAFVAAARRGTGDSAAIRARWLERQVRGVELLSSREKLMAGLPTYGTYFGRDMLVAALMMRPIWRDEMSEFVVASALRKLSPSGQVSHEEALGGQAVREAAAEYAGLVDSSFAAAARGERATADSLRARAGAVLRDARRVRENYHMIDDELQLPVLAARWLADPGVSTERKRAFLLDSSDGGGTRLGRLLRELALVARMTERYARDSTPASLISFAPRDSGRWASTSWRDSNAGYANGRFAMDVNAIWAPHALEAIGCILGTLRELGFSTDSLAGALPDAPTSAALARYARDPRELRAATDVWWGASRHFVARLGADDVRARVAARLDAMPPVERAHWRTVLAATGADRDSLVFLDLALDATARPVGVVNTDPATGLFLGGRASASGAPDSATMRQVLRDVRTFVRAYPVGLFIERVGPVAANDTYASPAVWAAFRRDPYHGPRVVWGREVNLFLLGVAHRIVAATDTPDGADGPPSPALTAYVRELREAAERVQSASEASGFQSELWSYDFVNGRPTPVRYGSGADVQLWSTTDLVVQYMLARMRD
jgi:hypothetical protein